MQEKNHSGTTIVTEVRLQLTSPFDLHKTYEHVTCLSVTLMEHTYIPYFDKLIGRIFLFSLDMFCFVETETKLAISVSPRRK